jgi:CRISPR-associated endonuclease Cas1
MATRIACVAAARDICNVAEYSSAVYWAIRNAYPRPYSLHGAGEHWAACTHIPQCTFRCVDDQCTMRTANRYSMTSRTHSTIVIVDGYAVTMNVDRGHLVLADGVADQRRERHLYRSDRDCSRIVVLSSHGTLSLSALQWCADVGIAVVVLDPVEDRILSISASAIHDDARLRRTQANAGGGVVGLVIAKQLLDAKLAGQAQVLRSGFGDLDGFDTIERFRAELEGVDNVQSALLVEANAAQTYFGSWAGQAIRFAKTDAAKVPPHWLAFMQRTSPISTSKTPRQATDPINAMLNYCYTLAGIEATIACHAMGLDPGLGVLHSDKAGRDSLAWDLVEAVRPHVDEYVLNLVKTHTFTRRDFAETRDGCCRILEPLSHELAATMPTWAAAVAPYAEAVTHTLVSAADGVLRARTPLTGRPRTSPAKAIRTPASPRPAPACPECGGRLGDRRRVRCPDCTDRSRLSVAGARIAGTRELITTLETSKITGDKHRRELGGARSALNRQLADLWDLEHAGQTVDPEVFRSSVLPALEVVPVSQIRQALNIGNDAAWRIRNGTLTPHPRHWEALQELGSSQRDGREVSA